MNNAIPNFAPSVNVKRSLAIASLIMMGSVLLSRIMGMAREMVLAHLLGTNAEMDSYVAAFIIPELLNHFIASGFLSVTFIPIFQRYIVMGDREKAWKVFSNLFTIGSVVFILFIIASIIFADQFISLLGGHIGQGPERELTVRLTKIIMPAQLLFYWGAFFMAVQYANHRFFLPALAPLLYNLGIISCGWAFFPRLGVSGFAWGVLVGAFFGNVIIQLPGALKVGMRLRPRIDLKDKDLKKYILLTLPLILGLGMTFSNEVFFRYFGSFLGTGALATVSYSLRTMLILVGVFGLASGVASFPFLSRLAVENKLSEMNRLLNGIIVKIGAYCIPCCVIMMALSTEVVALLFQHGSFTAKSTAATAPVLALYLIGAFPFAASTIVMRNYYAMQNTFFPMMISTIIACLSIPCYLVFSKALGAQGIALAASMMMFIQFALLYWAWSARRKNLTDFFRTVIVIGKISIISLVGGGCCIGVKWLLTHHGMPGANFFQHACIAAASGLPSLILIFSLLEFMKISDARETIKRLFAKVKA